MHFTQDLYYTHYLLVILMCIFVSIGLYFRVIIIMMCFVSLYLLLVWGYSLLFIHLISMQIDFHSFVSHFYYSFREFHLLLPNLFSNFLFTLSHCSNIISILQSPMVSFKRYLFTGWPMQIETNFRMIYFTDRKV